MLSNDMKCSDIFRLNYCDSSSAMNTNVLLQCISNKEDKKRFIEDYNNAIKSIFAESAGIDSILYEFLNLNSKDFYIQIVSEGDGNVYMNYWNILYNILCYVCRGKNFEMSDIRKTFEGASTYEEAYDIASKRFVEIIRTLRKELTNIDIKECVNDQKVDELMRDYPSILTMAAESINQRQERKPYEKYIDIWYGVKEGIDCLTQLIFANKKLHNCIKKHPIDLEKYNINKEKLAFVIFSGDLDYILAHDNGGEINKNIYPILSYFKETVGRDNSNLSYYDYDSKTSDYTYEYTYKSFLESLQEYVKKHRDVNCDILPFDYFEGWSSEEVDEFLNIFTEETLSNFKEIDPGVLFLPNSKGTTDREKKNTDTIKKEAVFSLLPLEKREFYSKNRDKIHMSLLGEKKFKGYILNVLNNGYVIFERYDTKEGDISSKSAAAYIMNIFNFKSLYEMSPSEVRSFIKSQDKSKPIFDRVDYKCHMGNWQEHLQKYFDEDTGITPKDVDEVLAMEKVKIVEYVKKIEEEN